MKEPGKRSCIMASQIALGSLFRLKEVVYPFVA